MEDGIDANYFERWLSDPNSFMEIDLSHFDGNVPSDPSLYAATVSPITSSCSSPSTLPPPSSFTYDSLSMLQTPSASSSPENQFSAEVVIVSAQPLSLPSPPAVPSSPTANGGLRLPRTHAFPIVVGLGDYKPTPTTQVLPPAPLPSPSLLSSRINPSRLHTSVLPPLSQPPSSVKFPRSKSSSALTITTAPLMPIILEEKISPLPPPSQRRKLAESLEEGRHMIATTSEISSSTSLSSPQQTPGLPLQQQQRLGEERRLTTSLELLHPMTLSSQQRRTLAESLEETCTIEEKCVTASFDFSPPTTPPPQQRRVRLVIKKQPPSL